MDDKVKLRQQQKQRLADYRGLERLEEEKNLQELLFQSNQWQMAKVVALTLSLPAEFNTAPIIQRAWQDKKQVVVPKIVANQMFFVLITPDSTYKSGMMSILEPVNDVPFDKQAIDLAIIPGLAYTRTGYRLGYGAGYFDRFLSDFHGKTIALAMKPQLVDDLPIEPHDEQVEYILNSNMAVIMDFWRGYLKQESLSLDTPLPVFDMFGNETLADELATLIVNGTKTATASWYDGYLIDNEPIPVKNSYFIVLNSKKSPVAIIQNTDVTIASFDEVNSEHAYLEGEGDRSLNYWRTVHQNFWESELAMYDVTFNEKIKVVLERFKVVYQ